MIDDTTVNDNYAELFEVNAAIVEFARKKTIELNALAELHEEQAARCRDIADQLAEVAHESARLIAKGIAVEAGIREDDEDDDD